MQCVICKHGETTHGQVNVTLERNGSIVIIKGVPAEICKNCGEYYLSEDVTEKVMTQADASAKRGTEVEITQYAA